MQTKRDAALEALANILIGMGVAFVAQLIWFPSIGVQMTLIEHVGTTLFFTAVSFMRSYALRRWFNKRRIMG